MFQPVKTKPTVQDDSSSSEEEEREEKELELS